MMEQKLFIAAVGLAWLALPLTAWNYQRAWDRLPQRVAVHFDINWQPNGWASREAARDLALGTTAFLLTAFTFAAFTVSRQRSSSLSRWMMVLVFYVVLGLIYSVNKWIVDRSLISQQSSNPTSLTHSDETDASNSLNPYS
jgi:hypothetical protein